MGLALSEETLFDPRSGRCMNPSLAEYHVPVLDRRRDARDPTDLDAPLSCPTRCN
jgi:hypothetical protein